MALLHFTWFYAFYNGTTSLYMTLHYSTIDLLQFAWLDFLLHWIYFTLLDSIILYNTLLDSIILYHGSTSLYLDLLPSTMAILHSTNSLLLSSLHYCTMALLHFTQRYCLLQLVHFTLHDSALATFPSLYFTLVDSTLLNHGWTSLYMTVRNYHGSASL